MIPPLLLAADLDRAEPWAAAIRRSHGIELLASLDLPASGVSGLDAALEARPEAAVAVWAAGEREATRVAERLVAHEGPCLLHPPPARPPPGRGVQVVHGWLSLSGVGALERLFSSRGVDHVQLVVRGLPEGPALGLAPVLYQAMALVLRLGTQVAVTGAVLENEDDLTLSLRVDEVDWRVEISCRGWELQLIAHTGEGPYAWSADGVSETLQRPRAEARAIPAAPWEERCLAQLARPVRGADLEDARAVRALVDTIEGRLERPLPPLRFEVGSTADSLAPLGLAGVLPDLPPLDATPPPSFALPTEAVAYALDLRPAVFLTVEPQDEARVRGALPGHIERRERKVCVGPGDVWHDDRSRGEPRVELFAARDPDKLRRLVDLQVADPSESLSQIGAILGYPACCVQAFGALGDRSQNSFNRVATAVRTSVGGAWPKVLDDTTLKLLPHYACTYRCERSVEQAQAFLDAIADEVPRRRALIDGWLGGSVLYFDHDHQIRFDGEARGSSIRYKSVSIPWVPSEPFGVLAAAIAQGERMVLEDDALVVYIGDDEVFRQRRIDPHLGVLMPFAR